MAKKGATTVAGSGSNNAASGKKPASPLTTGYLILYNLGSFTLWATLTLRLCLVLSQLWPAGRVPAVHDALAPLLQITQSLSVLEVLHSLFGLVRASVVTTAMQVLSRIVVVWMIMYGFSEQVMGSRAILGGEYRTHAGLSDAAFIGCLTAWGVTECIRYAFFVLQLAGNGVPGWLLWLRYNTFFVLYPLGIGSECTLVYLAIEPAQYVHPYLPWAFKVILGIYVPGSYILYTHMMAQRRKVLRAAKRSD